MLEINQVHCLDVLDGLSKIDSDSINLVISSPPYLKIRKSYESKAEEDYLTWFSAIGTEIFRILLPNGSFILNINDSIVNNTRSTYVHELVVEFTKTIKFNYFDKMVWIKKNGLPTSGPLRRADYFEYIFHFSKGLNPVFNVDAVREPYAAASIKRAKNLIINNTSNKESRSELTKFKIWKLNKLGSWPKNTLFFKKASGKEHNHPAPFDISLPEHFIKAHSNINDLILDPFCGSGTTCLAAKNLGRRFVGIDNKPEYIEITNKRLTNANN